MTRGLRGRTVLVGGGLLALLAAPPRSLHAEAARGGRASTLSAPPSAGSAPAMLAPLFRAAVPGIVLPGSAVSADGDLFVATAEGDVAAISRAGTVSTFASLDEALGHGPVALGAGRFVVTGTKTPLLAPKAGGLGLAPLPLTAGRFQPSNPGGAPVPPVSDGADGVWFVRGTRFLHTSGTRVLADGPLPRPIIGLAGLGPLGAVAFDGESNVYFLGPSARPPLSLGASRNATEAVALGGSRVLVACNDGSFALIDLDTRKIESPALPKHQGSLVKRPGHGAAYFELGGNLVLLDERGALGGSVPLAVRSAELAGLPAGEVAAALPNGDVAIIDAAGAVRATGKGCETPLSLTADRGRLLVVCRDGRVVGLGDGAPSR